MIMKLFSRYFCIFLLGSTQFPGTLLSKGKGNHSSWYYNCDSFKHVKLEEEWTSKISEDIMLKKRSLNILSNKRHEFSLSVPGITEKTDYLENFPNRFTMVDRLTNQWPLLSKLISDNFGNNVRKLHIPVDSKLLYDSALLTLIRLQETYDLTTESLSRGEMEGTFPHTAMTSTSIMDVALFYHRLRHPWRAEDWLLEALDRSKSDNSVSRKTILEYLYVVSCYTADLRNSTIILNKLLKEYPSLTTSEGLQDDYKRIVNTSCFDLKQEIYKSFFDDFSSPHFTVYQANLCTQELYKPPFLLDPRLRCRLLHYNKPHLRLSPYKMEELNLDPPILLVYDVINDGEIETIKRIYKNKTRPAMDEYIGVDDRYFDTQYNAWLNNRSDPITMMINQRTGAAANLATHLFEPPMVASYGLGAEIKLHDDLVLDEALLLNDGKTRPDYLSFLIYLNDVAEGGYTIFPYLHLSVVPVKRSALMWHNRLPDWTRDDRTLHSSCPVLRGYKWIINKWFHVREQHYPKCYPGGEKTREYYYLEDSL